ncbi:XrtA system polysaccharide chain length determinant [Pontixanthobacter aquaemixtae]|uniref:Chain-length determining protein n=1 Tax=Pontixanthobacter aquaemixtae TaxID=1958940 RepID=A0A844ZY46_9SPHN|nr:XrtA system polysaccharide chain length determinant [Pontixanthobacter aquaemixtae]MXO90399.1 chain-length determining protein [Pontixanthobacter aquaemixtae]
MNEVFEDLRAALFSVWHRRWLALGVAWGVSVLGWLVVAMIPNSYESEARIYVQLDDVLDKIVDVKGAGERDIARVRQTLASKVNLEKVIRSTKLGDNVQTPRDMENAIESLTKKVTVKSEEDNLFEIKAEVGQSDLSDGENSVLAQSVVQKLIDIFREENIAGSRGDVAESIVFLDQQLEERKRELEEAEQRRLAFEAENPDLIGGTGTLSEKRQLLRSDLRDVEADLAAAQSALAQINGQLAGTPRTLVTAGAAGGARQALANAQSQLATMQASGKTGNHPDVIAINKQIALLRTQAANENPATVGTPNPAYSSLIAIKAERQANVQALAARQAGLQSELSGLLASQANNPAVAAEASRISRDYEVLKDKYDELLQDREEMKLRGQVENQSSSFKFEVIDPPSTPQTPSAPNRPLLLIGVLIAGIAAGVGSAFAVGQLRSTFATTGKLERALDLPVLGAISTTMTDTARALRTKRMKMFYAGSAGLAGLCVVLLAVEFLQRGMVA